MKKIILIILMFLSFKLSSQEIIWDQGIPTCADDEYIVELTDKINLVKIKESKVSELTSEERAICLEIGLAFYAKREYEVANWYFDKTIDSKTQLVKSQISAEKEKPFLIKEIFVPVEKNQEKEEVSEMKKDIEVLNNLPKSFENVPKNDLTKLKEQIKNQIAKLLKEKDSLIKIHASQQVIESKDGTIKTLKKESKIIDLTIENDDLNVENKGLEEQKRELRKYLMWSIIGISLLVLFIIAILQRKTIKVQDGEIQTQLKSISKKNTYLEHAAKIIRHDMHSGINTYIPRGLNSLEKRLTDEDIKNLKLELPIKMIKEGLSHTQKVYKNVYEFTNLVKTKVVFEKTKVNVKEILDKYLLSTTYSKDVVVDELVELKVNEILFCSAIDALIKNGMKYNNNEDKKVKIYMEEDSIVVEDNGVGLSENKFKKILDKDMISEEDGLGLNICSTILNEHGFQLSCEEIETGTKMKIKIK
jgi:signal transduction histidine kinase